MYCSSFAASRSALRFTYSHMMWYKNHKFHFEYLPKPWNVIRNVTIWAHIHTTSVCSFVWQCFARSCSIFAKLFSFHSAVCDTHSTRDSKHKNISYPIAENKPQKQFTFSSEKVHARWKGNRIHSRIVSFAIRCGWQTRARISLANCCCCYFSWCWNFPLFGKNVCASQPECELVCILFYCFPLYMNDFKEIGRWRSGR